MKETSTIHALCKILFLIFSISDHSDFIDDPRERERETSRPNQHKIMNIKVKFCGFFFR